MKEKSGSHFCNLPPILYTVMNIAVPNSGDIQQFSSSQQHANGTGFALTSLLTSFSISRQGRGYACAVLQPGFKKGRVHIIKRALSSREAASWGECRRGYPPPTGGGYGDLPQENF